MSFPIYVFFLLISVVAGFSVFFQKNTEFYLKTLPFYLIACLLVTEIGNYMGYHYIANQWLYNVFSVLEFAYFFLILRDIIRNRLAKKILFYISIVYPVLAFLNIYFIQKTGFHTMTYTLGCLLLISACIYYFIELFQYPQAVNLLQEPAFWITTAVLFCYCCSFPMYGTYNLLKNVPHFITKNITIILTFINILEYSLFTIAFLCRIKIRRYT